MQSIFENGACFTKTSSSTSNHTVVQNLAAENENARKELEACVKCHPEHTYGSEELSIEELIYCFELSVDDLCLMLKIPVGELEHYTIYGVYSQNPYKFLYLTCGRKCDAMVTHNLETYNEAVSAAHQNEHPLARVNAWFQAQQYVHTYDFQQSTVEEKELQQSREVFAHFQARCYEQYPNQYDDAILTRQEPIPTAYQENPMARVDNWSQDQQQFNGYYSQQAAIEEQSLQNTRDLCIKHQTLLKFPVPKFFSRRAVMV